MDNIFRPALRWLWLSDPFMVPACSALVVQHAAWSLLSLVVLAIIDNQQTTLMSDNQQLEHGWAQTKNQERKVQDAMGYGGKPTNQPTIAAMDQFWKEMFWEKTS